MAKLLHRRIAQISRKALPNEACGFVVEGKAIPLENQADDPTGCFLISAHDYLTYRSDTIFHSHPEGVDGFSEHDRLVAANMELTSYLYVVEADRLEILSPNGDIEIFDKVLGK
tara:strand:- start:35 stop:376 length:342 start_codon:yes stop_codon:yes gene_type:complete